jgi:hypothetical protein
MNLRGFVTNQKLTPRLQVRGAARQVRVACKGRKEVYDLAVQEQVAEHDFMPGILY